MRKIYTLVLSLLIFNAFLFGQQVTITGTSNFQTSNDYGPFNTDAGDNSNRHAYIYSASLLNAMSTGASITSIGFERGGTSTSAVDPGASLKIYLANTTTTDFGTADLDWSTAIASATLVYDGDPSTIIDNSAGWKEFALATPFTYGGNNLAIYVEYIQTGLSASINWVYNHATGQPGYSANQTKYGNSTTLTPPSTLTSENERHPNLQINYTLAGCTDPATPGQAISNVSSGICANSPVILNLTGNSTGSGMLYKWQSSTDQFGTYSDISSEASGSAHTINPTATMWYRAVVKCGPSGTPQNSAAVQVVVNPALPAGTYTINNTLATGGTNFQSFTDAINSMNCGISGHVIFEVSAGQTFNESLDISLQGTSSATVTFRKSGTGANPKISKAGTSASAEYLVKLTGADYITFDGIDFEQTGTSSSDWVEYGIFIANASATNGAQNNTFKNGVISLSNANSAARGVFSDQVTTASATSGTNSYNKFLNMTVRNSFNAYYFTGNTNTYPDDGNEINTEASGISRIENLGDGSVAASMYGVYCTYQSNFKLKNTQIMNLLNGGTSLIYSVYFLTSTANSAEISGNTFSNISGGGTLNGIYMSSGASINIFNNKFSGLRSTTTTSSAVRAIDLSASGLNATIYSNQIYDVSSAGLTTTTVAGIEVGTGLSYTIYNNMISDLRASNSTSTAGSIRGVSVAGGSTGGVVRIYYNTIVLSDVGTTANYTSAGIYNSSTTPTLDIRNNIIINRADVSAGTRAVALWKTSATVNIDVNSNNNLYYAGTPSPKNLIYYDGTNGFEQIADYKTFPGIPPREENSVTENVSFLPITAGIIRIDPNTPSLAESGGKVITGYSVDFEGTQRGPYPLNGQANGGGTNPDIGADEYDGRGMDVVGPVIDFVLLTNTSSTTNRTITATITDVSGVRTGADGPRLYYRKSGSTLYAFDNNPTIIGDQYTFTFDYAALGGVTGGDVIEYYLAAQDQNGYSSTSPFGGSGANPPGTTAPGTPATYRILYLLSGTYTVGTTGNHPNLTAIANLLNGGLYEVGGNTVFELQSDYDGTTGETFPIQFNQFLTNSNAWTVTIRPALGVTARVTSGDPGSSNPLINLNGIDKIILDGRPGGTGTTSEWTLRNIRTSSTIGSVIRLINDAANNTIQYLQLESQATSTAQGLIVLSTSASGTTGNSNNTIAFNRLSGRTDGTPTTMSNGIYSSGTAAAPNVGNLIKDNHIVNSANYGIYMAATGNGDDWAIERNHLYGDIATSSTKYGIYLASGQSQNVLIKDNYIGGSSPNTAGTMTVTGNVTVTGIYITNGVARIEGNTIGNISSTSTGTSARVRGIYHSSDNDSVKIINNTIYNLSASGTLTGLGAGSQVVAGISAYTDGDFFHTTITDNTIYNLSAENTDPLTVSNMSVGAFLTNFRGIFARNKIYNIKNKSTGTTAGQPPIAAGLYSRFFDEGYVVNNMISIGQDETNNVQFNGIMINANGAGNEHYYYNNSVYISGSSTGDFSSFAFLRGDNSTTTPVQNVNIRNNIFYMLRTGGTAANFAIGNQGTNAGTEWVSDYNVLYNTDNTRIGYWNATGYNLTDWQTTSTNDANSRSLTVNFIDPLTADFHLTGSSVGNQMLGGTPIAEVTTDYDLQARSSVRPYIGADEAAASLPVHLEYFKGTRQNNVHLLTWKGHCTGNDNVFTIERSANGRDFSFLTEVTASAAECSLPFTVTDQNPLQGTNYYRLKIKDENGRISYSMVIAILNKASGLEIVSVFPTVTSNQLSINASSAKNVNLSLSVVDMQGKTIQKEDHKLQPGTKLIHLDVRDIAAGTYLLQCVTSEGFVYTTRFIKQ